MTNESGRLIAVLIFPLVFALTAPALPAADAVPDSATIREKMRAANGPAPPVFRETDETVVSNGSTTIERDYVTASGRRYTFDTGRFHTERGVNGTDAWHMNDNGQVILDQPDPGLATREQMTTTVEAIHTPVEAVRSPTICTSTTGTHTRRPTCGSRSTSPAMSRQPMSRYRTRGARSSSFPPACRRSTCR